MKHLELDEYLPPVVSWKQLGAQEERLHQQKARLHAPHGAQLWAQQHVSQSCLKYFSWVNFSQLLSSVSVIVPPADSSYGNHDITADIAIHENSNGWGLVARRALLRKVVGQAAKGLESTEHVVLHPGDFTLLLLFSLSYAKLLVLFFVFFFHFFFSFSLYSLLTLSQKSWQWAIWAGVVSARYHNLCKVMKGLTHRSYDQMKVTVSHLLIISVSISVHFRSISGKDFPLSFTYTAIHGRFITKSSQKWQ